MDSGIIKEAVPRLMALFQIRNLSNNLRSDAVNLLNSWKKRTEEETLASDSNAKKFKPHMKKCLWLFEQGYSKPALKALW